MSEALKALREARETLNRLLAQYPTGFTNWKAKKGVVTYEQTTDLYRTGQYG